MNTEAPKVKFGDQIGLSIPTIRINDGQMPTALRPNMQSQPAKLLLLGLLIMTCLCGSLYYATMTPDSSVQRATSLPR